MRSVFPFTLAAVAAGHGQMNYPPSTRQGLPSKTWPGALSGQGAGGFCEQPDAMSGNPGNSGVPKRGGNPLNGACMLFSQPNVKQPKISIIPGEPTLNQAKYRTNNVNVSSGPADWSRKMPWRDPGMARKCCAISCTAQLSCICTEAAVLCSCARFRLWRSWGRHRV